MAAVRRSSESGVIVALVVFVVLAFVGLGCAVWFYQQLSRAKQTVAATQDWMQTNVQTVFDENTWQLSSQTPDELGVMYTRESFAEVGAKLRVAAEYEGAVMGLLGWDSLAGMQDAVRTSPVQTEAEAKGEPTFPTLSGLLAFYERRYGSLTDEVATLRTDKDDLSSRLTTTLAKLLETQKDLGDKLNQEAAKFRDQLAKLRTDYNELVAKTDQEHTLAMEWQQKYQQQVDQRKQEVASLQDDAEKWKKKYDEAISGPEEQERLVPDGKVLSLDTEYDFVYVEGGQDKGVRENDVYVVFGRTPGGEDRRKGSVMIGQVGDRVSRAIVTEEKDGTVIVEGDYVVSLEKWQHFHAEWEE